MIDFNKVSKAKLSQAYEALAKNGITDIDECNRRIEKHFNDGHVAMFQFGSLLHTGLSKSAGTYEKASVEGMQARFSQAFTYYGGEAGRYSAMLALDKKEGEVAHGLIQKMPMNSIDDVIEFYDGLQIRENPVNNPIYNFKDTIKVKSETGEDIECVTCLSNTEGPLHFGEHLTDDEVAYIIAYGFGPDSRLDNGTFRSVEGTLEGVEVADLQAHHQTSAAYVYHYLSSYNKWGFPKNEYLEGMVDKINRIRRDMAPITRETLEAREDAGNMPDRLGPRFFDVSEGTPKEHYSVGFQKYVAAVDKLNNTVMQNQAYQNWDREWRGPDHENLRMDIS